MESRVKDWGSFDLFIILPGDSSLGLFILMNRGAHTIMGTAEQILHSTHTVCFKSFRMWRICGSSLLIAGDLGGSGGSSSVLFMAHKKMFEELLCGVGWNGIGSFKLAFTKITVIVVWTVIPESGWSSLSFWKLGGQKHLLISFLVLPQERNSVGLVRAPRMCCLENQV